MQAVSAGFHSSREADDGSRTRDLRLGKPTLYQLSYVRAAAILRPIGSRAAAARAYYSCASMRRFVLPALVVCAAGALLALLAFGVARQGNDTSIDAAVAKGQRPPAPEAHVALPVLGTVGQGEPRPTSAARSSSSTCSRRGATRARPRRRSSSRPSASSPGRNGTVLGVTYLDNSSDSEQFVRQEHITYPVVRDVSGNFVRSFGTTGVPETFVIDRHGRIAALRRYQLDGKWLQTDAPARPRGALMSTARRARAGSWVRWRCRSRSPRRS